MASSVAGVTSGQTTGTNASSSLPGQQLGAMQFLQLLTTEMQNQDPLKPVDDTQSVAQLAQFSSLQATEEMNQSFQNFQSNFSVMQASGLIGHNVSVETTDSKGNSSTIVGSVNGIVVQNGTPYFTMKGSDGNPLVDQSGSPQLFSTNQIIAIES